MMLMRTCLYNLAVRSTAFTMLLRTSFHHLAAGAAPLSFWLSSLLWTVNIAHYADDFTIISSQHPSVDSATRNLQLYLYILKGWITAVTSFLKLLVMEVNARVRSLFQRPSTDNFLCPSSHRPVTFLTWPNLTRGWCIGRWTLHCTLPMGTLLKKKSALVNKLLSRWRGQFYS